ncbi:hypothetical protein ACFPYI_04670 [Halomarina salina]|uniref:Tat pathway signal protein n=1 Tax=Halomarina salina TaxID=1872699 RepID=A0ABD5RJW8_9EURY|nr:hypothetical protein [Halomarina salina]
MPSRRAVLGGCAGLLASLAGCSLPALPGEEPHPTREWLYAPGRFADDWRRYRVVNRTPVLWDDHREWLDDQRVADAIGTHRPYYGPFGVETRDVDWQLRVGGVDRSLPRLCVSAAAFNRGRLEDAMNATTEERVDDYQTMAMYRTPDHDRAFAAGGDYLVDCQYDGPDDPATALRTCIDTQTGSVDRFTTTSEHCRLLADALADDAEFAFDVFDAPSNGVVGRGWRRLFDEETTHLTAVVLFADEASAAEASVRDSVSLPSWRPDRETSVDVDGRLGVVIASRPTETVRLDAPPFQFA